MSEIRILETERHGVQLTCIGYELGDHMDDFLTEKFNVLREYVFNGEEYTFMFGKAASIERVAWLRDRFLTEQLGAPGPEPTSERELDPPVDLGSDARLVDTAGQGVTMVVLDDRFGDRFEEFMSRRCYVLFEEAQVDGQRSFWFGEAASVEKVRELYERFRREDPPRR